MVEVVWPSQPESSAQAGMTRALRTSKAVATTLNFRRQQITESVSVNGVGDRSLDDASLPLFLNLVLSAALPFR